MSPLFAKAIFAARIDAMAQAAAAEAVEFLSFGTNDLTPDLPCSFARDEPDRFLATLRPRESFPEESHPYADLGIL